MFRFMLFLLIVLCFSQPASAQTVELKQQLQQRYSEWVQAFLRGDGPAMDTLERDDLTLVQPDGSTFAKQKPRSQTVKRREPPFKHAIESAEVRQAGDTAILSGVDTQVGAGSTRFLTVWRNEGGAWRVWAASWTEIAKKK